MGRVTATAGDAGRQCPYCQLPLVEGAVAERCDACGSLHHENCWRHGGGCAVPGCTGSVSVAGAHPPDLPTPLGYQPAASARPGYQPAPPTLSGYSSAPPTAPGHPPAAPAVASYPPAPPTVFGYAPYPPTYPPPRRGLAVIVVSVIVALLGVGIAVVVATGVLAGNAHAHHGSTHSTTTPPGGGTSTVSPTGASAPEQRSDRSAITAVLGDYQSSYSNHNIAGLEGIFTPEISRRGLAASGCTVSHGRAAVLADYRSQFEAGSGSYELVGFSEGAIQIESKTRARINAYYRITPGGSGYVNFKFVELGEGWEISEVYATCK